MRWKKLTRMNGMNGKEIQAKVQVGKSANGKLRYMDDKSGFYQHREQSSGMAVTSVGARSSTLKAPLTLVRCRPPREPTRHPTFSGMLPSEDGHGTNSLTR